MTDLRLRPHLRPRVPRPLRLPRPASLRPSAAAMVLAAACALLPARLPAQDVGVAVDRVAAVVNGDAIVMSEVGRRVRHLAFDLRQRSARLPPRDALVRQAMDELILERLQLRIAQDLGIRVQEAEVDRAVEGIARRNDLAVPELRRMVEAGGVPFAEFHERIRNDVLIERVRRREVLNRIRVGEAEVDRYLAQPGRRAAEEREREYLVAHILIPSTEDEAAARARADEVAEALRAGADFADLARRYSAGGRAAEGGLLGWRTAAALPSLFAEVVPRLERGEVRGAIEGPAGLHFVRLVDVRSSGRSFVPQTRAAHILIRPDPLVSEDEARVRLERLRERIAGGEDFGELARLVSDDSATAVRGGDLGWLSPGTVDPIFEEAMGRLGEDEVSAPFRSSFGWHLVKVLGHREYDDSEEVRRNRARRALFERKAGEALRAWLGQLRDTAFVKLRLDE